MNWEGKPPETVRNLRLSLLLPAGLEDLFCLGGGCSTLRGAPLPREQLLDDSGQTLDDQGDLGQLGRLQVSWDDSWRLLDDSGRSWATLDDSGRPWTTPGGLGRLGRLRDGREEEVLTAGGRKGGPLQSVWLPASQDASVSMVYQEMDKEF